MDAKLVWEAVKPNVKQVLLVVVEQAVFAAIEEMVKQSDNKFDDGLWPVLKPAILAEVKNQIEKI